MSNDSGFKTEWLETAAITAAIAERDFWKELVVKLSVDINRLITERNDALAIIPETDHSKMAQLIDRIAELESELGEHQRQVTQLTEQLAEAETAKKRMHTRLLEVVAERNIAIQTKIL